LLLVISLTSYLKVPSKEPRSLRFSILLKVRSSLWIPFVEISKFSSTVLAYLSKETKIERSNFNSWLVGLCATNSILKTPLESTQILFLSKGSVSSNWGVIEELAGSPTIKVVS
jgi:hypothetical protein